MAPLECREIAVDQIIVRPQVRRRFTSESLQSLAQTVRADGIQHPLTAYLENGQPVLQAGERRLRAATAAGETTVPVLFVKRPKSEAARIKAQLVENLQREALTPIETAAGFRRILELTGCSHAELAGDIGTSGATITRLLALLDLPPEIQELVHSGKIAASTGYKLAQIRDPEQQARLAKQVVAGELTRDALSAAAKPMRSRRTSAGRRPIRRRVVVRLSDAVTLTVDAANVELEHVVSQLDALLARARQAMAENRDFETFVLGLSDVKTQ